MYKCMNCYLAVHILLDEVLDNKKIKLKKYHPMLQLPKSKLGLVYVQGVVCIAHI